MSPSPHAQKQNPLRSTTKAPSPEVREGQQADVLDADIPVRDRTMTDKTIPRRVDDLVDREVDAKGTPKPHPKSLVNKAMNGDGAAPKKKRIIISDDDDSDDDVPLVHLPRYIEANRLGCATCCEWIKCFLSSSKSSNLVGSRKTEDTAEFS